jgi:hypothetical protein
VISLSEQRNGIKNEVENKGRISEAKNRCKISSTQFRKTENEGRSGVGWEVK